MSGTSAAAADAQLQRVQTALGRVGVPLRAFDRLKQIGMVLNVEAVDDVQQFRTRKGWKLLPAETKLVLSLRADFDKRRILALNLN